MTRMGAQTCEFGWGVRRMSSGWGIRRVSSDGGVRRIRSDGGQTDKLGWGIRRMSSDAFCEGFVVLLEEIFHVEGSNFDDFSITCEGFVI